MITSNNDASGGHRVGRKSQYDPDFAATAYRMALLGKTDAQLAEHLGISETTLKRWRKQHEDLDAQIRRGKDEADSRVAKALFERALGYDRTTRVEYQFGENGERVPVREVVEHLPGDVQAAKLWLCNRQPERWKHGADAGAVAVAAASASAGSVIAGLSDELYQRIFGDVAKPELPSGEPVEASAAG